MSQVEQVETVTEIEASNYDNLKKGFTAKAEKEAFAKVPQMVKIQESKGTHLLHVSYKTIAGKSQRAVKMKITKHDWLAGEMVINKSKDEDSKIFILHSEDGQLEKDQKEREAKAKKEAVK